VGERSIQLEAVSALVSRQESAESDESEEEENVVMEGEENRAKGKLRYVYQRKGKNVPTVLPVSSSLSRPSLTRETPTPSIIDLGNIISLDSSHVMLRRTSRSNAGNPLGCYGFP
jgi:hypothetical protein